tara:strand:- start:656 stop:871 length:216 start_codon:yes stop_codon:yes gene_type:complete
MFGNNVSKIIVTFAFFYSAIICFFKGEYFYEIGELGYALGLWVCALLSFLGALRFQIAKLVKSLRKKNGKH